MKMTLVQDKAKVHEKPNATSIVIKELCGGTEFDLGNIIKESGAEWVEVTLPDGLKGYIPGNTRATRYNTMTLAQDSVDILGSPGAQNRIIGSIKRGGTITMMNIEDHGDTKWLRVKTASGLEGFIHGDTLFLKQESQSTKKPPPISVQSQESKKSTDYSQIVGGIGAVIGIIIASSNGGGGLYTGRFAAGGYMLGFIVGWIINAVASIFKKITRHLTNRIQK